MTEVAARVRWAAAEGEIDVIMRLLDEQALDVFFGVPLQELRTLLLSIPANELRVDPSAFFVVRSFFAADPEDGLDDPALVAAAQTSPIVHRWMTFAAGWRARMRGDVVESFEMLRAMPDVTDPVPMRVDPSGGMRSLFLTQAALSAALAGEFREALVLCDKAVMVPPTRGLEFFARDAHLLAALIHAVYGDRQSAGIHQARARSIPRSTSWIETQLDAEAELLAALLAPTEVAGSAFDAVLAMTYQPMGEVWPFFVIALERLGWAAGRRAVARERIEALRATGLGEPADSGYAGSVIPQTLALDALLTADVARAREELSSAAPSQWGTGQIAALLAIRASDPAEARHLLRSIAEHTRGLRRAEQRRILTLAMVAAEEGDDDEAVGLLDGLATGIEPAEHYLVARLSSRLQALAERRVDGWPVAPDASPGATDAPHLTERELRVLEELGQGQSRSQIARALFVSENTVKTHQRSLYRKLHVGTAEQAVLAATRLGML